MEFTDKLSSKSLVDQSHQNKWIIRLCGLLSVSAAILSTAENQLFSEVIQLHKEPLTHQHIGWTTGKQPCDTSFLRVYVSLILPGCTTSPPSDNFFL